MRASAVLVTRGDCDLTPILDTLRDFDEVVVWDNSKRENLGVYGRYQAIREARNDLIYSQDDDILIHDIPAVVAAYEPDRMAINYPPFEPIPWIAHGAVFRRDLPWRTFDAYAQRWPLDDHFFRFQGCDALFALTTPLVYVDVPFTDLPHAFAPHTLSAQPDWYAEARPRMLKRAAILRGDMDA